MTYHEFRLPPDLDFEIALGVTPQPGEEGVRRLALSGGDGLGLDLTLDPLGRTVSAVLDAGGSEVARIVREGATGLRLSETAPEIVIAFATQDTTGQLEVSVHPALRLSETSLLT